jgi:hypothetical protein
MDLASQESFVLRSSSALQFTPSGVIGHRDKRSELLPNSELRGN